MITSKIILIIAVIIFLLVLALQVLAEVIDYRKAKKEDTENLNTFQKMSFPKHHHKI